MYISTLVSLSTLSNSLKDLYTSQSKCFIRFINSYKFSDQVAERRILEDSLLPISSIDFDYKPSAPAPRSDESDVGNLYENMAKQMAAFQVKMSKNAGLI